MGFSFAEHMNGTFHFLTEPLVDHPIAIDIEAHVRRMPRPFGVASVVGRIRADGLANTTLQGTLGLQSLHERRIPYELFFTSDGGRLLQLVGEKDLSWLAPIETLVVLPFTIVECNGTWNEIARGTLRSDARHDWRTLVRSLRASPF